MPNYEPGQPDWAESPWLRGGETHGARKLVGRAVAPRDGVDRVAVRSAPSPSGKLTVSVLFLSLCFLAAAALLYFGRLGG